jgi:RND family efflux transporter MFP subunit
MIMKQKVQHRLSWKAWLTMLLVAAIALPIMAQNAAPKTPRPSNESKAETPMPPSVSPAEDPTKPKAKTQDPGIDPNVPALPEDVPGELPEADSLPAILKPSSDLRISSLHSGTVLNVHVADGDAVKKDQVLLELRNTEMEIRHQEALGQLKVSQEKMKSAELAIRQAQAALDLAKLEKDRGDDLSKRAAISNAQFESMKMAYESAAINVQKAELEERATVLELANMQKRAELAARLVDELVIKAPVDGVVLEVNPKAGELVKANEKVARIVGLSPLMAETYVRDPEGLLGQKVLVEVRSAKKVHQFAGKVTFVSPLADPVRQDTLVRCLFKNAGPDGQPLVRPGQMAAIRFPKEP